MDFDAAFRSPAEIGALLRPHMQRRELAEGAVVHGPDNPSQRLYFIERGSVRFFTISTGGEENEIFRLDAGEYFGEIGLFAGIAATHYAVTNEASVLHSIDRTGFIALMDEHTALRDWMLTRLARRLLITHAMLDNARGNKSTVDRVWDYCHWLTLNGYAKRTEAGEVLLELTQSALAGRTGLSRSSVAEALRVLREQGRIRSEYRGIVLLETREGI